jgi:FdhD protein
MMSTANESIQFVQFEAGHWQEMDGNVIVEMPVSLTINGELWLTMMCTPIDLEALAVGFLFNEGLLESRDEIVDVRVCPTGDNVDVWLNHSVEKPAQWRRTSGCTGGMTSVESSANQTATQPIISNGVALTPEQISGLVARLFEAQNIYRQTGGVHTSALCDGDQLIAIAEDIGRHNTLDKLAGLCLLNNTHCERHIVVTTGRISSEMMQKSRRLGASIVISRTSPSSLSIQLANQWGITLIGYTRRNRFNIYAHPGRVIFSPERNKNVEQTSSIQAH